MIVITKKNGKFVVSDDTKVKAKETLKKLKGKNPRTMPMPDLVELVIAIGQMLDLIDKDEKVK